VTDTRKAERVQEHRRVLETYLETLSRTREDMSNVAKEVTAGGGDDTVSLMAEAFRNLTKLVLKDQDQQEQGSQGNTNTARGAATKSASLPSENGDRHDG